MLHRVTAVLGLQAKSRAVLAVLGTLTAVMAIAVPAIQPATAQAEYYWGCSFTYGHPCTAPGGGGVINRLWTTDPDHAIGLDGYSQPFNGYKIPVWDNRERYVCGGAYWAGGMTIPYSCSWGYNFYNLAEFVWGEARISSSVNYNQVSLYQNVNIYE